MCIRDRVHGARVIRTRLAGADSLVLESRQARQHVHGGDDALAVQIAAEDDLAPVSYTHLDVYKRQVLCVTVEFYAILSLLASMLMIINISK